MGIRAPVVALALLTACFVFERDHLQVAADAPVEIRSGCALAESRCTKCHTLDRVKNARIDSPAHWQVYVHRMRLQPQSGILPDEEDPILHCLVFRSFGPGGVAQLK